MFCIGARHIGHRDGNSLRILFRHKRQKPLCPHGIIMARILTRLIHIRHLSSSKILKTNSDCKITKIKTQSNYIRSNKYTRFNKFIIKYTPALFSYHYVWSILDQMQNIILFLLFCHSC